MGSDPLRVLIYRNSRWLSLGNSLSRVFELGHKMYVYLKDENHACTESFSNKDISSKLFFLTDLFEKLNILNKSLKGNNTNILNLEDKVGGFKNKLDLWNNITDIGDYSRFPARHEFLEDNY